MRIRQCTRATCPAPAVATLTYVYADSTAVLGPLATSAEPHSYDLCAEHAQRLTVPRGWEVMRLQVDLTPPAPTPDDMVALAEAVREASRAPVQRATPSLATARLAAQATPSAGPGARRGHLRVLDGGE